MAGIFEIDPSGRARCRGCGRKLPKGALRFGDRFPNPFGDGEATLWFHPACGALKRPEPFREAAGPEGGAGPAGGIDPGEYASPAEIALWRELAEEGIAHRRLPRLDGAEPAPSGRARCRRCREMIAKDAWRIKLVYFEEGRFEPSGFVHASCGPAYFETANLVRRVPYFTELSVEDLRALENAIGG
jgi:hypothetical protein